MQLAQYKFALIFFIGKKERKNANIEKVFIRSKNKLIQLIN